MLLLKKVKVEMADNQGQTAVHLSAGSRHPDAQYIFKLLLETGAVRARPACPRPPEPDQAKTTTPGRWTRTPCNRRSPMRRPNPRDLTAAHASLQNASVLTNAGANAAHFAAQADNITV